MPLTVARTFYLNSTLPPDAPEASGFGERVKRILPNGERAYYVYKASALSQHSGFVNAVAGTLCIGCLLWHAQQLEGPALQVGKAAC